MTASPVRTAGHTPTPWHVDHKLSVKYGDEERWSFKIWATDEVSKIQFYICTSGENYWPSQNPNAAFICRAVNSHDELVEALKEACDTIKDLVRFANNNGGEYPYREFEDGLQAIAKAEGRS